MRLEGLGDFDFQRSVQPLPCALEAERLQGRARLGLVGLRSNVIPFVIGGVFFLYGRSCRV
jgi:hypothetical protein